MLSRGENPCTLHCSLNFTADLDTSGFEFHVREDFKNNANAVALVCYDKPLTSERLHRKI
jgi:hypothetical protein